MALITTKKVVSLPAAQDRTANTLYFVKAAQAGYLEMYLTSLDNNEVRKIVDFTDLALKADLAHTHTPLEITGLMTVINDAIADANIMSVGTSEW